MPMRTHSSGLSEVTGGFLGPLLDAVSFQSSVFRVQSSVCITWARSDAMTGESGLTSMMRRPRMYSIDRESAIVCAGGKNEGFEREWASSTRGDLHDAPPPHVLHRPGVRHRLCAPGT